MTVRIGILWPQTSAFWTAGRIYTENLLTSLALAADDSFEVVVIEPSGGEFAAHVRSGHPLVDYVAYEEPRGADLPARIARRAARSLGVTTSSLAKAVAASRIDVVFGNLDDDAGKALRWVAWIPDFQHVHYPDFFAPGEVEARDETYMRWASQCTLMLLSSRDCENDFRHFAPDQAAKGRVAPFVSLFPDEYFDADAERVARNLGISHPFVIVPNQWWRHKDHEAAVRAAAALRIQTPDLTWVFTGAPADHRDPGHASRLLQLISELGVNDIVKPLGALPRFEQVQLMRCADLVVQPSLFEGWSTVVEDAKTLGQRIVLSDIAVHREQEPPNALLFEPSSADALARAVFAALAGEVVRGDEAAARQAALVRARAFGERFASICIEAAGR